MSKGSRLRQSSKHAPFLLKEPGVEPKGLTQRRRIFDDTGLLTVSAPAFQTDFFFVKKSVFQS